MLSNRQSGQVCGSSSEQRLMSQRHMAAGGKITSHLSVCRVCFLLFLALFGGLVGNVKVCTHCLVTRKNNEH